MIFPNPDTRPLEVDRVEYPSGKLELFAAVVMILIWGFTMWAMPDGPGSHPRAEPVPVSSADAVSIPIAGENP